MGEEEHLIPHIPLHSQRVWGPSTFEPLYPHLSAFSSPFHSSHTAVMSAPEGHGAFSSLWELDIAAIPVNSLFDSLTDFILGGSKITADGDCSHEIKRCLLLGRKAMTNLDSMLTSRDYFANKCLSSQRYGFSCSLYECESWTIKKAERWRIGAFELWCWRTLLRVSWTTRRSKQSVLKEITPDYSLEGLMLKLKFQYFGHQMRRTDSLEKADYGKDWRQEEKGTTEDKMVGWHYQLNGHEFEKAPGVSDGQVSLACCGPWGHKQSDTTEQVNWNELNWTSKQRVLQTSSRHITVASRVSSKGTLSGG